jgi:cell division protein FtsB
LKHTDEIKDLNSLLTIRQRKIVYSPIRLILLLIVSVMFTEFLDIFFIERLKGLTPTLKFSYDAIILIAVLLPVLYFYLFRPLVNLVHDYKQNESQLKIYQNHLLQKVTERTRDLEEALERLKKENMVNYSTKMALSESEERFRQLF